MSLTDTLERSFFVTLGVGLATGPPVTCARLLA